MGPSDNVDASTVSGALNIIVAGLPPGWEVGHAPWSRMATAQSDTSLASCIGLPVAHLGILSGTTEPGGPHVEPSGWFTSQDGSAGIESYVVVANSAATQQSDVAAIMANGTQSCLQGWFASLDQAGDQIVGVPTVVRVPVAALAGERASGFSATVVTRVDGTKVQVNEELVVLGAGRVEVGLVSESTAAPPPAQSVESSELSGLEHRLKAVTTS